MRRKYKMYPKMDRTLIKIIICIIYCSAYMAPVCGQKPIIDKDKNKDTNANNITHNSITNKDKDLNPQTRNILGLREHLTKLNGNQTIGAGGRGKIGKDSSTNPFNELRKLSRNTSYSYMPTKDFHIIQPEPSHFGFQDLGFPRRITSRYQEDNQHDSPNTNQTNFQLAKDPVRRIKHKFNNDKISSRPITESNENEFILGVRCTFESNCSWTFNASAPNPFIITTGSDLSRSNLTGINPGPATDATKNANGHFLHLRFEPFTGQRILKSPTFSSTLENCMLEILIHQSNMVMGKFRIVIEPVNQLSSAWVSHEMPGNDLRQWENYTFTIDKISKDFNILFEIVPPSDPLQYERVPRGHVSIDDIRMRNCFPEMPRRETCDETQIKCLLNKVDVCIRPNSICDIVQDCDDNEDELANCDKIPYGGRCDFEKKGDWCGWYNTGKTLMLWAQHSGPTPTDKTGPDNDHTFQHVNNSGHYMFVNMNQHGNDSEMKKLIGFASNAVMNSIVFNPPPSVHSNISSPYRNSCVVRLYIHQFAYNPGSLNLSVVEMKDKENVTYTLWWNSKSLGVDWVRIQTELPNITSKYFLQLEARMGMRIYSDVAIDDFSLTPECFGLNIPPEFLNGYNYWDPRVGIHKQPHKDFSEKAVIELNTCGAKGIIGPSPANCTDAYNNTPASNIVKVLEKHPYRGVQLWRVPSEGYYTIIAKGAGGGLGSGGVGSSRGAMVTSVLELHKDEDIYMLVGQSGQHACIKSMGYRDEDCEPKNEHESNESEFFLSKTQRVKNIVIEDGAGGGGGGTFVYLLNSAQTAVPLLVAGGGGGLGIGRYFDDDHQHGRGIDATRPEITGMIIGDIARHAGPGGGWGPSSSKFHDDTFGLSLKEGGKGGRPCYSPKGIHGQGGFGGGGGGCNTGGGGGGLAGGDTNVNSTNGEGGSSYVNSKRSVPELSLVYSGANSGPGAVYIIPAISGCGCDYRCVALDEFRSSIACICPDGWRLKMENFTACELIGESDVPMRFLIIFFVVMSLLLIFALTGLILILYNRYQRRKQAAVRHQMLLEQDLQLSRLRHTADDSALTNFNPNYGCDGILNGNVDVKNLPQVARESLRLVKALGQGAFGEVYQGLYRHRDGDAVEMPVAVKTLPEMSTGQAEADFLMEAAIMAKFNHPNIVHLIGVCFDKHPRFIVLELLAGGDLKNFLREGRNKPERPSPLTMKDLVFCALDVAKGCRYMESKRFIHRDIAARNCLLSSKGPGRVVKIADFGMARDIYRSDYYRKGGKAMLPIKWMPPEAFLDGIFTSKTDVWSFGVLLWEIFSLGLMPYTGLPNRDVMQLVTGGGRLDAPPACPQAIYKIMKDCWNPTPEERPSFSNILERLSACTQDLEVMNAPLPSFFRPPSNERDQTIMRPPGNDDFCLQVPSSDYLIPLPGPRSAVERLLNEVTGVTLSEAPATYTAPKMTSPTIPPKQLPNGAWETSFMLNNGKALDPTAILLSQTANGIIPNHLPHSITNHNHENVCELNNLHNLQHHQVNSQPVNNIDKSLISLDTPQQTPTTIVPPVSFGPPLSHVLIAANNSSSLNNNNNLSSNLNSNSLSNNTNSSNLNHINQDIQSAQANNTQMLPPPLLQQQQQQPPSSQQLQSSSAIQSTQSPITLDPLALTTKQGTSYANVRMMNNNSNTNTTNSGALNGNIGSNHNSSSNNNNNNNSINSQDNIMHNDTLTNPNPSQQQQQQIPLQPPPQPQPPPPFTIQGFNERFISNDNHSEISC